MTASVRQRRTALVGLLVAMTVLLPAGPAVATDPAQEALGAGRAFLDRYVEDGRVVRRDQGGDTVSEGQAYALLVAAALDDRRRFDQIWSWTSRHLQRDDGLLAWRWADGAIVDPMPASDADLAAASALALAGARFSNGAYLVEARRIAAAIVAAETAPVAGQPTLVPGPWAVTTGTVNLSYFMVNAMSRLLWATGDHTWAALASSSRRLTDAQTGAGARLPPDWSSADGGSSTLTARSSPDGRSPRFGYEAARVIVQFAVDCDPNGRAIAARAWPFFDELDADVRAEYTLEGEPLVDHRHPVTLVAAAASADAAGAHGDADALLDEASALDARHPTYYGSAWIALARLWLDTSRLGGCRS